LRPKLLVVAAARSFEAEVAAIVGVFARQFYAWAVLSNDPAWPNPDWPSARSIQGAADEHRSSVMHFAPHGVEHGLAVRPSIVGDSHAASQDDKGLSWEAIKCTSA
jgi:hypothetical protein